MQRTRIGVVLGVLLIAAVATPVAGASSLAHAGHDECTFPVERTDATGETVHVEESPERVVTTSPSAAQTLWEFDAADKVVGLTEHALYLEGADQRTVISGEEDPIVIERVVDLDPDLVLAPNTTQAETVAQLREAGLTVYHFPAETGMADVLDAVNVTGALTGECAAAEETTAWMAERLDRVETAVADQEHPSALYVFFGFTAGAETFVHEIITTAGAENAAAAAGITGFQPINEEVVLDADPDWIILNSDDPALPESAAFNETTAVQEDRVVVVPIEHLNQPAPRAVLAIEQLAEAFHPEAMANATTDETTDTGADTSSDGAEDGGTGALPGFGPLVAIAALLGSLWLARR